MAAASLSAAFALLLPGTSAGAAAPGRSGAGLEVDGAPDARLLVPIPDDALCPSLTGVKAFHGDVDISLDQSASRIFSSGEIVHVKLVHLVAVRFSSVEPVGGPDTFQGQTTGNVVKIEDTYTDITSSGQATWKQAASGPATAFGGVTFSGCEYDASLGFVTATTVTSPGSEPKRDVLHESADSGARLVPKDLQLSGSTTAKVYCPDSVLAFAKGYLLGPNVFDDLFCGGHRPNQAVGDATMFWDFTPVLR